VRWPTNLVRWPLHDPDGDSGAIALQIGRVEPALFVVYETASSRNHAGMTCGRARASQLAAPSRNPYI